MNFVEAIYYHFYQKRRCKFEQPLYRRATAEFRSSFPVKIISIGNITTGGTGKTPAVQWVARLLQSKGLKVAVVARGYGGRLSQSGAVVSDGSQVLIGAGDAGDEPVLHARSLPGIPVIIGRDRMTAVRTAVQRFGVQVIVLDDGFQYWSLPRDLDVVLLDARRPFDNGHLLPVGRLREPPEALQRTDVILLTRSDLATAEQCRAARAQCQQLTQAPVFEANHTPLEIRNEQKSHTHPLSDLHSLPIGVVSALADNQSFVETLQTHGANIVATSQRRDHHHWKQHELQQLVQQGSKAGAKAIVTTEKDAVKMQPTWSQPLPLWSLRIELQIRTQESALQALIVERLINDSTERRL